MDRRHNDPQTPHERARVLASDRLSAPLETADEAWLEGHLAGCDACRAIAAAYAEDRALLRAMPVPEPPRDLWARTSVALERERAGRSTPLASAPRLRIRWQALAGTAAVLLVGVVAGRALLPPPGSGVAVTGSGAPSGGTTADATPLDVSTGDVAWAAPGADGTYTVNLANLDSVCPETASARPDCGSLDAGAKAIGSLRSRPGQVVLAPEAGQAAVVDASAATTGGSIMVVPMDPPTPKPSPPASQTAPTPTPKPSATATTAPTESPTAQASSAKPPASGSPSPSAGSATASPSGASPSISPKPTPSAAGSPDATDTPLPTATAAALAIIEDVIVVGGDAAYSTDGEWLAFSARPADGSAGPDVFVWRVGDERAVPLTDDHGTVFSAWVDDKILASRAAPAGSASASGASADPGHRLPISIQLDPATGKQRGSDLVGLWRPVVDPTGRWVVYWKGSLVPDGATHTLVPAEGRLVIDRWDADLGDGPDGTSGAQPLVDGKDTDPAPAFEARWDPTGRFLGLWRADPLTAGLGRLDLLAIDRTTGLVDPDHKPSLRAAPALAGFAIGDGRIAWATPPGQDGDGSRLLVLAWKGPDAGRTRSQPAPEDIVVVR